MEDKKTSGTGRWRSSGLSLARNLAYAFGRQWRLRKLTVICCGLAVAMQVAQPFIGIWLPKLVIDLIGEGAAPQRFIAQVGLAAALVTIVSAANRFTKVIVDDSIGTLSIYGELNQSTRLEMTIDYELLEDPEVLKIKEKSQRALQSNRSPANNIPRYAVNALVNLFGLLLYGGVVASINPLILAALGVSALINWLFLSSARRYYDAHREELTLANGKMWYLQRALLAPEGAKDVRLYGMAGWLMGAKGRFKRESLEINKKIIARNSRAVFADSALVLLRDGAAYAYLVYLLMNGRVELGDFVMAFAAIGGFASWISGLLVQSSDLMKASSELNDLRAYYAVEPIFNAGSGPDVDLAKAPRITLSGVSYTYPKASEPALKGVSLEIAPGERIAVVGANGAGKTTLIKLICGLYKPKEGEIRVNGIPSGEYNRDEYYKLFSAVFQDIHVLAESVMQNVSQARPDSTDRERAMGCLGKAGLLERATSLAEGVDTPLVKAINEGGAELSGGERQKLALARALYKDAPAIILDEPTAALDPIAESEVYGRYAELTAGKTSIYISHRLASTRFCDRIIFLDGQGIAEEGSHDSLMELGGKYAEMFNIQAHYYREGSGEGGAEG